MLGPCKERNFSRFSPYLQQKVGLNVHNLDNIKIRQSNAGLMEVGQYVCTSGQSNSNK